MAAAVAASAPDAEPWVTARDGVRPPPRLHFEQVEPRRDPASRASAGQSGGAADHSDLMQTSGASHTGDGSKLPAKADAIAAFVSGEPSQDTAQGDGRIPPRPHFEPVTPRDEPAQRKPAELGGGTADRRDLIPASGESHARAAANRTAAGPITLADNAAALARKHPVEDRDGLSGTRLQGGDVLPQYGTLPLHALPERGMLRPEPLATQLVDALAQMKDGQVELSLAPEELGRVRLTLTGLGDAMTIHIRADRSDTLDLLRRNIAQLAQEIRSAGYANVAFDFGENRRHTQQPFAPQPHMMAGGPVPDDPFPSTPAIAAARLLPTAAGLDLRL